MFATVCNCAPQGYNYQHQSAQSSINYNIPVQTGPFPNHEPAASHQFLQSAISQIGGVNINSGNLPVTSVQTPNYHQQHSPIVTKDIYIHAAPEEPEEHYTQPQLPNLPPRKHYRIVFIKAPTQNIPQQSIRVSQAPTEEKTIIYVLSKKEDPIDIQTAIQNIQPTQPSKPEVYFIKYKTQEEAVHAQKQIQGK